MPAGIPMSMAMVMPAMPSMREAGKECSMILATGCSLTGESPISPCISKTQINGKLFRVGFVEVEALFVFLNDVS